MPPRITTTTRDALAVAFNDLVGNGGGPGVFRIFDGTKPDGVDDGNGNGTQLASMSFASVAFQTAPSASNPPGMLSLTSRLYDNNTDATGTPTWGLIEDAAGTKLLDFDIPDDLEVPAIIVGGTLTVAVLYLNIPSLSNSASGDINMDGVVDSLDLGVVLGNYGQTV